MSDPLLSAAPMAALSLERAADGWMVTAATELALRHSHLDPLQALPLPASRLFPLSRLPDWAAWCEQLEPGAAHTATVEVEDLEQPELAGVEEPRRVWAVTLRRLADCRWAVYANDITTQQRYARLLDEMLASRNQLAESLGTVVHELKQPITSISGFAALLAEQLTDPDQRQLAEVIAEQSGELRRLTEDLLVSGLATASRLRVMVEPIAGRELTRALRRVAAGFPQREIPVRGELTHRGILADRRRLGQVVRGLIANALRYGGPRVWLELRELQDRAVVEVHDDGAGLSPQDRERVFEPFQSGEAGLGVGTEVGLAVARALVNDMGGLLEYRDGCPGAVFAITLPLVGAVPRPAPLDLDAEREALLAELVSYRPEAARRRLNRITFSLPPDQVIGLLLAPLMREVGDRWQRGEISVTQEHHASSLVLGWVVGQLGRFEPTTSATVVCAAAPGSRHELGIASVAVVLAQHGFRTLYLGGSAPVSSLVQTVTDTGACALLLSATVASDVQGIAEVGEALQEAGLHHVLLGFGGRAFTEGPPPEGLPGRFLGSDPGQAVELMESHAACMV